MFPPEVSQHLETLHRARCEITVPNRTPNIGPCTIQKGTIKDDVQALAFIMEGFDPLYFVGTKNTEFLLGHADDLDFMVQAVSTDMTSKARVVPPHQGSCSATSAGSFHCTLQDDKGTPYLTLRTGMD